MPRYHIQKCPGTLRDEHSIYDTEQGCWFHTHLLRKPLWTWFRDRAKRFSSFKDAAAMLDQLEHAGDKAIETAANAMNPVVRELIFIVAGIVAVCVVGTAIRIIGQFMWGW